MQSKTKNKIRMKVISLVTLVFLLVQVVSAPLSVFAETSTVEYIPKTESADESSSSSTEEDYEEKVELKEVTEKTVDTKSLAVNADGVVLYDGKPLYVGKGDDKIPAKLDKLMKEGVTQELVAEEKISFIGGIVKSVVGFISPKTANASDAVPVIKYNGQVTYGWTTVGDFTIDGVQAFCIEHSKSSPPSNTPYNSLNPYDNAKIQKALYYGWNGPGNVFSNRDQGIVITSSVLSRLYSGEINGENNSGYDTLWNKVQNGSIPTHRVSLSDSSLSVSVSGTKQISQSTTFNGDSNNSITFSLPSGVTVVNESTGSRKTGGAVTIKGGQKFHLEASLTRSSSYSSGTLRGTMDKFQPIIALPKSSGYQVLAMGRAYTDPTQTVSFTVPFKLQQVTQTVKHIDRYSDDLVKTTTTKRTPGTSYKSCPISGMTKSGATLVATSKCVTGTTPTKNFTTTLYYTSYHYLTINYYDNYSDKFIKQKGRWTFEAGDSYSKTVDSTFSHGSNMTNYRIVGSTSKTGKMGRGNKTVNVYYNPYHDIDVTWENKYPNHDVFKNVSDRLKVGTSYRYTPPLTFMKSGKIYDRENPIVFWGKLGYKDERHTFLYELRRTVTVNYLDNRTGEVISDKKVYNVNQGDKYSETEPLNIKKGDYTYRYVKQTGNAETGTIGTNNIVINYYYDIPLVKVGLEKIQVYTAPADKGLPVKVNLSKENNYPLSIDDMTEANLDVSLYQGNTKISSKTYTAKSLPKKISFKVPAKHLAVYQKKAYTVKFESFSKNDIDVISDAATITTDGYTSSQRSLNVNNTSLSFQGVIMTERVIRKNMVVYNESLKVNLKKSEKIITGYGFEYPIDVVYKNDLGQKITSKFDFYVPKSLVDSYLTYPVSNNRSKISFDETNHKESLNQNVLTTTKRFELPNVNIEKRTGNLFSNSQVVGKDSRIKYGIIDGGRKFYTPIWGDLGTYQLEMKNVSPLGVHKINVSMKQNLEIYAFMYGHMDSTTGKQDAIYLRPINADDPKYPENWTAKDKARFKEWNEN